MTKEWLDRIEDKLDKQSEKLASIDITLVKQHESLDAHIKRTNLLEDQLKPIQKHVQMVQAVLKILGTLAIGATVVDSVLSILHMVKH